MSDKNKHLSQAISSQKKKSFVDNHWFTNHRPLGISQLKRRKVDLRNLRMVGGERVIHLCVTLELKKFQIGMTGKVDILRRIFEKKAKE